MKITLMFLILALTVGCHETDTPTLGISYLNEVLDVMEKNSVYRKTIDWSTLRSRVLDKASGAKSIQDIYPAITVALAGLGDYHSSYVGTSAILYSPIKNCAGFTTPNAPQDGIGYVKVNGFFKIGSEADQFAASLQDTIKSQDNANLFGWVIDLRGNNGGNLWPMLAGLGPILGEGVCGYYVSPDGNTEPWEYKNGNGIDGNSVYASVPSPYSLIKPNPKVAVLVNQVTSNIGEALAIAFIGRANTKLFGQPTCGITTASDIFPLSDGATLQLATDVMADRNKKGYGDSVTPDVTITYNTDIFPQAVQWLKQP
jgi:carboxyl-terminal processing protease